MRDERLILGFLAFHVLMAAPGVALLYAMGLVRARPIAIAAAAAPGFVLGLAVVGLPLIVLVVLGVPVGAPTSVVVLAAVTVTVGLAAMRRHRRERPRPGSQAGGERPPAVEMAVERLLLGVGAVYFVLGTLAFTHVPTMWDDANIWSLKGLGLYYHEGLVDGLGRNPQLSSVHLDYPILQPLLEASFFRAIGGVDLRLWHVELWVLFAAIAWTLAWLLASLGSRWPWVIVLLTMSLSGGVVGNVTAGHADLAMAGLLGCGALAFGIWLESGRRSHAVLGAVFLAAAANLKNEGLAFGAAVAVALVLAIALGRVRGRWKDLALSAGIAGAGVLPWQVWVVTNEAATRATMSPWEVIDDPGLLIDRLDNLWRGIEQVALQCIGGAGEWGLVVPAFLVVGATLVVVRRHTTVASFYLMAWLLTSLTVAYTYWVTPFADLGGFEQRTGPRIVLGVVFVAGAGLAHLLHLTIAVAADEPVDSGAPEGRPEAEDPVAARA